MADSTKPMGGDASIASRLASLSPEKRTILAQSVRETSVKAHDLIGVALARLGITHVYAICGTPIHEVARASAVNGIRVVGVRHQTSGVHMAAAHNYLAGRLVAAVLVSAGPGVTNALTGILAARDNCWPVIVLGGRRPLSTAGIGWFQELDAVPIMNSVTKWATTLQSAKAVWDVLARAYQCAISGRPGPVYVDLPEDVLRSTAVETSWPAKAPEPLPTPMPDSDSVDRAAELLVAARRPLLIVGKGCRWSDAFRPLADLVECLHLPFVTSPMGRGFVPDHHPLCLNPVASLAQAEADVVLVVGARLDYVFRFGGEISRDAQIVRIDIEPGELGRNRQDAVGLNGDARNCLEPLLALARRHPKGGKRARDSEWISTMQRLADEARKNIAVRERSDARPMIPHRLLREVREASPEGALLIVEGNVIMMSAEESLPGAAPLTRLTAGHSGCLGSGIPFAVAAKLERPDRPVIVVCGDFAFGLAAMELETAARLKLPFVVVIANNGGATGGLTEFPEYADQVTTYLPAARYEYVAEAFNGYGEQIANPADVGPALCRALASSRLACLNVAVEPRAPLPAR